MTTPAAEPDDVHEAPEGARVDNVSGRTYGTDSAVESLPTELSHADIVERNERYRGNI